MKYLSLIFFSHSFIFFRLFFFFIALNDLTLIRLHLFFITALYSVQSPTASVDDEKAISIVYTDESTNRLNWEFEHHEITNEIVTLVCQWNRLYNMYCCSLLWPLFLFLSSSRHISNNSSVLSICLKKEQICTTPLNHMLYFCVLISSAKTVFLHIFFY